MPRRENQTTSIVIGDPESERQLANVIPVSCMPWESIREDLAFPEVLEGLHVLDVGAGASDVTATLLEQGADAYAIDPRYKSRADVKGKARAHIYHPEARGRERHDLRRQRVDALNHWEDSMKRNPERYKTAYASHLPFPNEYFDLVISAGAIFPYLDVDYGLLLQATREALRVTKPKGTIQLAPFNLIDVGNGVDSLRLRAENHPRWTAWLDTNPTVTYRIEQGLRSTRVVITKK